VAKVERDYYIKLSVSTEDGDMERWVSASSVNFQAIPAVVEKMSEKLIEDIERVDDGRSTKPTN